MTRGSIERVTALVRAARTLADPTSPAGIAVRDALAAQGPLSPQGVDLALREHLEIHPTPTDLDDLVARAGNAPHVHVVLSANVFVGALRAIALALAAAPRVTIRSSRREAVFARALLDEVEDPLVAGAVTFTDVLSAEPGEDVHLYGSDDTMVEIARSLPPGTLVRAHGSGMGIVALGASADVAAAAQDVARDVVPFDQRGCLSPRVVVAEGSPDRALAFARALRSALEEAEQRVPTGSLHDDERAERTRYRDTCTMAGDVLEAGQGSVGIATRLLVPPIGRNVHVMPCDAADARKTLMPLSRAVASLGWAGSPEDDLIVAMRSIFGRARTGPAGTMQKPRLDGPVDLRVEGPMSPADVVRWFGG